MTDSKHTPIPRSTTLSWRLVGHQSSGITPLKLPDLSPPSQPDPPPVEPLKAMEPASIELPVASESSGGEQPASEAAVAAAVWIPSPTPQPPLNPSDPPLPSSPLPQPGASFKWSKVVGSATLAFGTLAATAFLWLTRLPPPPNCRSLSAAPTSMERLYCVRESTQVGDVPHLLAGIEVVSQWDSSDPLYGEAQESLVDWSHKLLWLAKERLAESDFEGAIELANQVPADSPVHAEAQAAIADWKAQWQQGEEIYAASIDALKQQEWNKASDLIVDLGNLEHDYWRLQRTEELTETVAAERTAWNTLRQARLLVKGNQPEKLSQAIALVQAVGRERYIWHQVNAELTQWGKTVTAVSLKRWQAGNLDGAIALALPVPLDYVPDPIVKDMIHYGRAVELATHPDSVWQPSWEQIWQLREATNSARQIQPNSPLYTQAQAQMQDWQAQLQDLTQLQFANITASIEHPFTYQLAIDQAQIIAAGRPRRLQAQTLAAYWGQEIQRMQDRPYLRAAERVAALGTIASFQQAIGIANQLQQRVLWNEAQAAIAQWHDQIEIIQDKPILTEAQTLADAEKLLEAIAKADTIAPDRALYSQAQAAINGWQIKLDEIEIAADRPILAEAQDLAARQRYTLAIETAAQVGSDRALYNEAQAAIAQWEIERQALLDQWAIDPLQPEQPSAETDYSEYPPVEDYSGETDAGTTPTDSPLY